jgi:hypothetical protein
MRAHGRSRLDRLDDHELVHVPVVFTVVDDFQQWLGRIWRRGAPGDEHDGTMPAPSAIG